MAIETAEDEPKYETLTREIHGEVLLPGDDGYDEARSIWNGMVDQNPAVVVRPTGAADVISAVGFAADTIDSPRSRPSTIRRTSSERLGT